MMKGNLAVAKGKAKLDYYDNKENASNSLIQNNQAISNGKGNSAVLRNLHPHHQRIEIDLRLDRNEAGRRLKDGRCVVCAVASDVSILACAFCERDTCVQCVNRCASCDGIFCRLCSTTRCVVATSCAGRVIYIISTYVCRLAVWRSHSSVVSAAMLGMKTLRCAWTARTPTDRSLPPSMPFPAVHRLLCGLLPLSVKDCAA
jgi:hypothetical protein